MYRVPITADPLDEQLVEGIAELILRGFAPVPARRATKTKRAKEQPR